MEALGHVRIVKTKLNLLKLEQLDTGGFLEISAQCRIFQQTQIHRGFEWQH